MEELIQEILCWKSLLDQVNLLKFSEGLGEEQLLLSKNLIQRCNLMNFIERFLCYRMFLPFPSFKYQQLSKVSEASWACSIFWTLCPSNENLFRIYGNVRYFRNGGLLKLTLSQRGSLFDLLHYKQKTKISWRTRLKMVTSGTQSTSVPVTNPCSCQNYGLSPWMPYQTL